MHRGLTVLVLGATLGTVPAGATAGPAPTLEVQSAATAATQAYRDAWLSNRPEAVMATLSNDAVLLPSGLDPISGSAAIRAFWWPPGGPPVTIISLDQKIDEVSGSGDIAIVRGSGSLAFTWSQDGKPETRTQRFTFLNVVGRQPDGRWLITHRMWSDRKGA